MTDNVNAFIYKRVYEIAQAANIGPETDSPEEFYAEVAKDKATISAIATAAAPVITAETGLPPFVVKKLVKFALVNSAKDANDTFGRIAKREEKKNKGEMQPSLAESKKKRVYLSEAKLKKMIKETVLETIERRYL